MMPHKFHEDKSNKVAGKVEPAPRINFTSILKNEKSSTQDSKSPNNLLFINNSELFNNEFQ